MQIRNVDFAGRRAWSLFNGKLELIVLAGGGHIAGLLLDAVPGLNPYWRPQWGSIEPWHYKSAMSGRYGARLLASISGHNVCLGAFGEPSPAEARAGLGCHGEAPVARWRMLERQCSAKRLLFSYACELPVVRLRLQRTLIMRRDALHVDIRETVHNLARCDVPFTMCQHVTFGPPFLETQKTLFDIGGTAAHTFPGVFGRPQRLLPDKPFTWPAGPGRNGKRVDLRRMGRTRNGDYYAVLMDAEREHAWFSAMHPGHGLLTAYVWRRADYPWMGVWEENRSRAGHPWRGRELARGMEFANTPFPVGLRAAAERARFQGRPTYAWLPARGRRVYKYALLVRPVPPDARAVTGIVPAAGGFDLQLI